MHTFDDYRPADDAQLLTLIRRHPFAVLVSVLDGSPVASHIPIVVDDNRPNSSGSLVGSTVSGHMATANPQWRTMSSLDPVLLVFTGPDAYVSAQLYDRVPAVPTWNYSAVHLTVSPERITDPAGALDVLTRTVSALEIDREPSWDMTESIEHFKRSVSGVVAFRFHIQAAQGIFKFSQDKSEDLWRKVYEGLREDGPAARCVSADMAEVRAGQPPVNRS